MPSKLSLKVAKEKIKRLDSLVEASQLLNSSLDLKKILGVLVDLATKHLDAERGTIYLIDRERKELWAEVLQKESIEIRLPLGKGIAGYVGKTGKTVNLRNAYKDRRFFKGIDRQSGYTTKTMLCTPMRNASNRIIGVFQILNKRSGYFNKGDEKFLAALSIPASIAIENARLHTAEIERQKIQKELEVAAAIQQHLLPSELPKIAAVELSAMSRPCRTVGGDFYDLVQLDEKTLALVIADVSGKGVSAALLVSSLQASLHAYLELGLTTVELISKLNRVIHESCTAESFITFVLCIYDASTHTLRYINAGHNYPIIVRSKGGTTELDKGGLCLGMLRESAYEEGTLRMDPGDLLILYTDGVTESMNKDQDLYGEARLYSRVISMLDCSVSEIQREIFDDVMRFSGGCAAVDDFTMVLMKAV